jgi:hypothetical protein
MLFGTKKGEQSYDINIKINNEKLDRVNQTKFLGIILDSGCTWQPHIQYITKKIAKSIGILSLARQTLNKNTLIQLYYSFIYPYLLYCNIIWGKAAATHIWPLFKLQKIAIRIIHNIPGRDSTLKQFHSSKILRLPEIHQYSIGMFMFHHHKGNLPTIFDDFFQENRNIHQYHTRNARNFRPPKIKSQQAQNFIKSTGANFWNTIKNIIPTNKSTGTFKNHLKTYLLQTYI